MLDGIEQMFGQERWRKKREDMMSMPALEDIVGVPAKDILSILIGFPLIQPQSSTVADG